MTDETNDKETTLDVICEIAWTYAGLALGILLTILTVKIVVAP